jgi:hypothetical protein
MLPGNDQLARLTVQRGEAPTLFAAWAALPSAALGPLRWRTRGWSPRSAGCDSVKHLKRCFATPLFFYRGG